MLQWAECDIKSPCLIFIKPSRLKPSQVLMHITEIGLPAINQNLTLLDSIAEGLIFSHHYFDAMNY